MGRIDVHSHLLPGLDDGCQSVEESLGCARRLVAAGYSHSFVTPHIWPNLPDNNCRLIPAKTAALQVELDRAGVPLTLMPGGELNLSAAFARADASDLVTYNMAGRYALFDFWTEELPEFFEPSVRWMRSLGVQPILAHPERIDAIQRQPSLVNYFADLGLLLQCNLEPLGDDKLTTRRRLAEQWLTEDRYFLLGSDLHNAATLDVRLRGLERAIELMGAAKVDELTMTNPGKLCVA